MRIKNTSIFPVVTLEPHGEEYLQPGLDYLEKNRPWE